MYNIWWLKLKLYPNKYFTTSVSCKYDGFTTILFCYVDEPNCFYDILGQLTVLCSN